MWTAAGSVSSGSVGAQELAELTEVDNGLAERVGRGQGPCRLRSLGLIALVLSLVSTPTHSTESTYTPVDHTRTVMQPADRKPLATLPLLPFLVASSSSSAATSPNKRTHALKHRTMSLLPSPFAPAAPTQPASPRATTATRQPLAPLDDASTASTSLASPSRHMMLDDDPHNHHDDDEPHSSPRRLIDAFLQVGSTSPGKRRAARMLPPHSPRRAPAPPKDDDTLPSASPPSLHAPLDTSTDSQLSLAAWTFFEDDASAPAADLPEPTTPTTLIDPTSPSADEDGSATPPEKENTRPPRRPRTRSLSIAPPAPPHALSLPAAAPTPTTATVAPPPPPGSPPRTPPAAAASTSSWLSPSFSASATTSGPFSLGLNSAGGAVAPFAFAESGATSFAAAALSPALGAYGEGPVGMAAFNGLLPAFAAGARDARGEGHGQKKRESGEGLEGEERAKRARIEPEEEKEGGEGMRE